MARFPWASLYSMRSLIRCPPPVWRGCCARLIGYTQPPASLAGQPAGRSTRAQHLTFKYHLGNGAGGAVSKRQVDVLNTFRDTAFLQIAVETQTGLAQIVATYLDIAPTHVLAQTCAKGFEERLLGSETRSITGIGRILPAAVGLLSIGVQALNQALSRAGNGLGYALDLDQVNADAVNHRAPLCGGHFRCAK